MHDLAILIHFCRQTYLSACLVFLFSHFTFSKVRTIDTCSWTIFKNRRNCPSTKLFSYHIERNMSLFGHFRALYKMSDECFSFSLRSNVSLSFAIQLHKYYTKLYTCNIEYICTKHSYFVYCGLIFLFVLNASMFGVCQRPLCILRWSCLFVLFLDRQCARQVCEESSHLIYLGNCITHKS